MEIRRVWRHPDEGEVVHLLLMAGNLGRHVKVTRGGNAALYDFLVDNCPVRTEAGPDLDPATRSL